MGLKRQRGRTPRGDAAERTKLDPEELRRAAKLARSMLPKGADTMRGEDGRRRKMADAVVVVEGLIAVGAAEGALRKTVWSEFTLKALAIVLADITDREAAARAVIVWRRIATLPKSRLAALRREVARGLREERRGDGR